MPPPADPAAVAGLNLRLEELRARIAAVATGAGRDPKSVALLPVTKGHPVETVRAAVAAGLLELGENYVQECQAKQDEVGRPVRWHLLGHLQRNKLRRAVRLFSVIESLDEADLAGSLSAANPGPEPLPVLLELELTGLPRRTGVPADDAERVAERIAALPGLSLQGLMTVAAPEWPEREFSRCREIAAALERALGRRLPVLSMGMSHDFEAAVAEGSTEVRIGTLLFGPRPQPPSAFGG